MRNCIDSAIKAARYSCYLSLFLTCYCLSFGQCGVTSYMTGNSFSANTSAGSFSWSQLNNVGLSDNSRASNGILLGVLASENTEYLVVKNFGFSLPGDAAICGIEVLVERRATGLVIGSSVKDNAVRLVKDNIIDGSNLASSDNWPGSDGDQLYGGADENWGTTWTATDINDPDFGVAISATLSAGLASLFLTAQIDQVTIRVYYNLVLPLQLVNFFAVAQQEKVEVNWAIISGSQNSNFTLERSANGINEWNPIRTITGESGNGTAKNYRLYDEAPLMSNFYRLKITDDNGHSTYSHVVRVLYAVQQPGIYPNPVGGAKGELTIIFPGKVNRVSILSSIGQETVIKDFESIPGGIKVRLPVIRNGYYWLLIGASKYTWTGKILVL